jgi:glutamate synthase (ferredoxin)
MVILQRVNLEDILAERGACGVGFVANLRNNPSHSIIQDALTALSCMEHRGGCGADNDSGDGAGIMTRIPWSLLNEWVNKQGLPSLDEANTGVGMVFLPKEEQDIQAAKAREFVMESCLFLFDSCFPNKICIF